MILRILKNYNMLFPHMQVLKFKYERPRDELLKNLKEFDGYFDNSLNLVIVKFCPNLRKIFTGFKKNELETLIIMFNGCRYLESIKIWCSDNYLSEYDLFKAVAKYSPINVCELILRYSFWA